MALTFIGQSVASAIIDNLFDTCSSYLMACPAASGMQDELERLQDALPQVQAVLTAVEECAPAMMQNKGMDKWLWQLRDAVENAENVLDELEYYELEKRIRDRDDKDSSDYLWDNARAVRAQLFSANLPVAVREFEDLPSSRSVGWGDSGTIQ